MTVSEPDSNHTQGFCVLDWHFLKRGPEHLKSAGGHCQQRQRAGENWQRTTDTDDRDEEAPFSEAEKGRETKPGLWGFNEAAAETVYKVIRC